MGCLFEGGHGSCGDLKMSEASDSQPEARAPTLLFASVLLDAVTKASSAEIVPTLCSRAVTLGDTMPCRSSGDFGTGLDGSVLYLFERRFIVKGERGGDVLGCG